MNLKSTSLAAAPLAAALAAAALLAPGSANASLVLDTGTPTSNSGSPVTILSTSQWVAAEFDVTTLGTITQLAAYLTEGTGNVGNTFSFDIYSASNFTGRANQRTLLYSTTGTYEADGWNTASASWTPTATGEYWIALQVSSTTQTRGLDLPGAGISNSSGTAPAQLFAIAGSSGQYATESTTSPTAPFGIQVTETPVPLPAAAWLLLSGLGGLGTVLRKRRI